MWRCRTRGLLRDQGTAHLCYSYACMRTLCEPKCAKGTLVRAGLLLHVNPCTIVLLSPPPPYYYQGSARLLSANV